MGNRKNRIAGYGISLLALTTPAVALAQEDRPFTYDRVVGILFGLVDFALTVAITIAVIMIVWYAIQIMLFGNNPAKYTQAKRNIWYAIGGAAIVLGVDVILATIENAVRQL